MLTYSCREWESFFMSVALVLSPWVVRCRSRWPCGLAWACCRSLAGNAGSHPAGEWMSVSCESCVLSGRSLRQADPSFRGVVPRARACHWVLSGATVTFYTYNQYVRGGADKSLARPERKEATATKLGIYSNILRTKLSTLLSPLL